MQGIINKLTAENVEYRDNNKTQQFEVCIQELQREVQQTGNYVSVAQWLVFSNKKPVHCHHTHFADTLLYVSGILGHNSALGTTEAGVTAAALCSAEVSSTDKSVELQRVPR